MKTWVWELSPVLPPSDGTRISQNGTMADRFWGFVLLVLGLPAWRLVFALTAGRRSAGDWPDHPHVIILLLVIINGVFGRGFAVSSASVIQMEQMADEGNVIAGMCLQSPWR